MVSNSFFFTPALRPHSFVFFAVHETRRIFLSPFISKASRLAPSFFLRVQLSQPYVATGHTTVSSTTQIVYYQRRSYVEARRSICLLVIRLVLLYDCVAIRYPSLSLLFQAYNLTFLQIIPTAAFPFLLQDWLHKFPRLFTVTSEHIRLFTF